jgi:hypothetical protein
MDGMLFVHQSCASSVEKPAKEAGVLHVATFIAAAGAAYAFATAPEMNLVILGFGERIDVVKLLSDFSFSATVALTDDAKCPASLYASN